MTDEELLEAGRQMGTRLLAAAVEGSKDVEVLNEQIFVCRATAIHILAQDIFNRAKSFGTTAKQELKSIEEELIWELREVEGAQDLVSFGGRKPKRPRLAVVK